MVGGGINGAGIARDAAGRGLRVLLIEQAGLAHHTSSASSKLIHGGCAISSTLQLRLVREALQGARTAAVDRPAPGHARPFVLPHQRQQRPAWLLRLALLGYDAWHRAAAWRPRAVFALQHPARRAAAGWPGEGLHLRRLHRR